MKRKYRKKGAGNKSSVELMLDPVSRIHAIQGELRKVAEEAAKRLAVELMADEVRKLCGEHYSRSESEEHYRHGHQAGAVVIGGQRVRVERPRVRHRKGKEVDLQSYGTLNHPLAMSEAAMARMVRGVSARNYGEVIEAFEDGYGIERSSVSRAFIRGSEKSLIELGARRFENTRFLAVLIDGIEYAGTTVIAAIGIDAAGTKRLLGLREGATENATVVRDLLTNLRERGLHTDKAVLFVIDGSKALAKGIRDVFGQYALIQRCRIHKRRNIRDHLPEQYWVELDKRLGSAWEEGLSYEDALKRLKTAAKWLERISPDAAESLREGMEEIITVNYLRISGSLLRTLSSTNVIESAFSVARSITVRVKRWRVGNMRLRWCATGLLHAEQNFRRVFGFRQVEALLLVLDRMTTTKVVDLPKKAA
jgi:transposase-like protein